MRFDHDGHAIDWEERGAGRTVVLVHGLTTDRRVMIEAFDDELSLRGFRRVYLDLPGHGASTGNPERASADALVDLLAAFTRHVAPDGAPVVAYAYGAYLALGLPREIPVSGLYLACPVVEPDFGRRHVPPRRLVVDEPDLPFSDDPREREAFLEVAAHRSRAVLATFQRVIHPANVAVDAKVVATIRYFYAQARPFMHALQSYEAPVAIACGRHDHWVGFADAATLASSIPRSSLLVAADCGHLLPLEAPQALRAHFADWLARLG